MRLHPAERKQQILTAALTVAARPGGLSKLTRATVAAEAACSDAAVSQYFGTMAEFKRTIMRAAIKAEILPIIAQGVASGDKTVLKASPYLRGRAIATLTA